MDEKNPINQLISIIENSVTRSSELVIEIKTLLNSLIITLNNSKEKDTKSEIVLSQISDYVKNIDNKINNVESINKKIIEELFRDLEKIHKSAITETLSKAVKEIIPKKFDEDRCISDKCPKKAMLTELKDDKTRIIESHEREKRFWKKTTIFLSVGCFVLTIGLILGTILGIEGIKMWAGVTTKVLPIIRSIP